jgi:hypothetical protein
MKDNIIVKQWLFEGLVYVAIFSIGLNISLLFF